MTRVKKIREKVEVIGGAEERENLLAENGCFSCWVVRYFEGKRFRELQRMIV